MAFSNKTLFCICGHYGVGKTNVAVSLALALKKERERVTLVDFDIVNPYFRSADNARELAKANIRAIVPQYANSNVDLPVLPPEVASVFETDGTAVFDVGGDDAGATALAGYRERFLKIGYELYCVINRCRPYIADPKEALQMIRDIESASGLIATGIINNTNLGVETTPDILRGSFSYAAEVCLLAGLPLIATTAFEKIARFLSEEEQKTQKLFPIRDATRKIF